MCFAISLVLSNMAYKYCTVAFLQMIKEGTWAQDGNQNGNPSKLGFEKRNPHTVVPQFVS